MSKAQRREDEMEQPEGLQTELLKCSRPVRKWVLELAEQLAAAEAALADERTARMSLETEQALIEDTLKHLRGLLREAVDDIRQRAMPDKDWLKRAQASLEGKP